MLRLNVEFCRRVLRPRTWRNARGRWTIWRDASGRQIHASLDPDNITTDVMRAAIAASGLCLACDAEDCPGPDSRSPWCIPGEDDHEA